MSLPRISLVTPSFNQASYLEQTIRSVLDQGYPNLQYGIVDGGSTDGSIAIIDKYRDHLDYAIIECDRGQSDAINKGLKRADGDVVGWLNSDDVLFPGALEHVGEHFANNRSTTWLTGCCTETTADGTPLRELRPSGDFSLSGALLRTQPFNIAQPATFWRRALTDEVGLLDTTLHYCMDFDLWCRFLASGCPPTLTEHTLATYRLHETSKTCAEPAGFHRTLIEIERKYLPLLNWQDQWRLRRLIGYQTRMIAVANGIDELRRQVARRPWWFASQQVRQALREGQSQRRAA